MGVAVAKGVTIRDLTVIDFASKHFHIANGAGIKSWIDNATVPFAGSCGHQTLYGSRQDFSSFPYPEDKKAVKTLHNTDAYEFLLRMVSGFESRRLGETHIRHQFYEGWREFSRKQPEKSNDYQLIYGQIKSDADLLGRTVLDGFKQCRQHLCARDLSGQVKGDLVLVVPEITNAGEFSENSIGIMRATENKQGHLNHFLVITHPDPDVFFEIKKKYEQEVSEKHLCSRAYFLEFDKISSAVEKCDRVYIDVPMNKYPDADQQIVEAWNGRIRNDNTMVHMKGEPANRGLSSDLWKNAGLENYFSPETVREDMVSRKEANSNLIAVADSAFKYCAELRMKGQKPLERMFVNFDPELLSHDVNHLDQS